jgi:hypothetical protein
MSCVCEPTPESAVYLYVHVLLWAPVFEVLRLNEKTRSLESVWIQILSPEFLNCLWASVSFADSGKRNYPIGRG